MPQEDLFPQEKMQANWGHRHAPTSTTVLAPNKRLPP